MFLDLDHPVDPLTMTEIENTICDREIRIILIMVHIFFVQLNFCCFNNENNLNYFVLQDILDTIIVFIMPITIMHILKIYDVQILLLIQNGIINIMLTNISNNIFLVVLLIIPKTEQVSILGVVLAMKG